MSRAFAPKDDPPDPPGPSYSLPDRGEPGFERAAAAALMRGAQAGDTAGAEAATGFLWGDTVLVPHIEYLLDEARRRHDERQEQLAERFLKVARSRPAPSPGS